MKSLMNKKLSATIFSLVMCLTLVPLTALATVLPGCPEDGQGMDTIWGYEHMEIGRQITEYAEEKGWNGRGRIPQGWTDYKKFSGAISIRNYTNVDEGQWWQLRFDLMDDKFVAVLKLYYSQGTAVGTVLLEESVGSGNLLLEELATVVDKCTLKISESVNTADSPSSWATEQVNAAIASGPVPESLQKNYTQTVSRGDVAQMFINLIEKSSGQSIDVFMAAKGVSINNSAFTDTTDKAALAANALGLISGVGNNRFDPDGTLTRAQIAAIINRIARVLGVETGGFTHSFTDVDGHWADAELGWPVHAGIINGVGNNQFDPDGKLITEQAIVITYRALQYFDN